MQRQNHRLKLMGTVIDIQIFHDNPQPLLAEVDQLLRDYERRFSANRDDSELAAINQAAGKAAVRVAPDLFELIELGYEHSTQPGSHLNICIGPLVQTWRIGFADAKVPTQAEINHLLPLTDPRAIVLDRAARSVYLPQPGMRIDLGALAKGYIADRIVDFLKSLKVPAGFINLGGNVLTFGPALHQADQFWRIGIQDPASPRGNHRQILRLANCSVVTSGIYERQLVVDGKAYHHILDPQTGQPMATDVTSLTIVSPLSVEGEIWTTRLFGEEAQSIIAQVEKLPNIEAIVQNQAGQLFQTSGISAFL